METWSGKLKATFHGPRHWELNKELWFVSVEAFDYLECWKKLGVNMKKPRSIPDNQFKIKIIVPKSYHTDLASIHRAAWSFIAPWDVARAAVIHDILYEALRENKANFPIPVLSEMRKNADNIMLEGMRAAEPDVPKSKVSIVYWTLRLLGGMALKNSAYRDRQGW
jgi:hypothetical protein